MLPPGGSPGAPQKGIRAMTTDLGEEKAAQGVEVKDGRVVIRHLVVEDRDLAEYLSLTQDAEAAAREAISLGARILRLAGTSGDLEMVKREFDGMTMALTTNVDKLMQQSEKTLSECLTCFTNEQLKASLDGHRTVLNQELVKLFGPESVNSVQRGIEAMLVQQAKAYRDGLALVLQATDDPTNPLFKLREELKKRADLTADEIRKLGERIVEMAASTKATAAERQKGTIKGREYQEFVYEEVERIARIFGDVAHYVADQTGQKGTSKAGDVLVELHDPRLASVEVSVVFEARNTASISAKKILDDLDEAMENRGAAAAIAVFSGENCVPSGLTTWRDYPGARYICVLRENECDPFALELSYRWARTEAFRSLEPEQPKLDTSALRSRLTQAKARLNELQNMKAKLTGAKDAIEGTQSIVERLQEALRGDFQEIDRLLSLQEAVAVTE